MKRAGFKVAVEPTVAPDGDGGAHPDLYGWDWSATTHDGKPHIVNELVDQLGAALVLPGKGLQGWPCSVTAYDGDGFTLGRVFWGGGREDVHVLSTGAAADSTHSVMKANDGARVARVDTRVDTLAPIGDLFGLLQVCAETYNATTYYIESKRGGESLGKTLYLGAPSSAIRVRCYEKHLQSPGQYVEGTNRVEVQLRPPSKVKDRVAGWSPAETFCASRTTRDLATRLGADLVPTASLHVSRGTPDLERTLEVMGQQYGPSVARHLEISGGDIGKVIDYLTRYNEGR